MGFQPSQGDISNIEALAILINAKTTNLPTSPADEDTSTAVKERTDNLPDDPADESALEAAISASEGNITDEIQKGDFSIPFNSAIEDQIQLTQASGNFNLPDVVASGLASGINLDRVELRVKIRAIENTSGTGANAINGASAIKVKKSTGTWGVDDMTAVTLTDNMWTVAASTRESGDVLISDDIKSVVDGNGTYNFRFDSVAVDYDYLQLNDIELIVIFYFNTGS